MNEGDLVGRFGQIVSGPKFQADLTLMVYSFTTHAIARMDALSLSPQLSDRKSALDRLRYYTNQESDKSKATREWMDVHFLTGNVKIEKPSTPLTSNGAPRFKVIKTTHVVIPSQAGTASSAPNTIEASLGSSWSSFRSGGKYGDPLLAGNTSDAESDNNDIHYAADEHNEFWEEWD
jgi:hypothetical protein